MPPQYNNTCTTSIPTLLLVAYPATTTVQLYITHILHTLLRITILQPYTGTTTTFLHCCLGVIVDLYTFDNIGLCSGFRNWFLLGVSTKAGIDVVNNL